MYQFYKIYSIVSFVLILIFPTICRLLPDTLVVKDVSLPCEIQGLWKFRYLNDSVTHLASLRSFMPLPYAPFSVKGYLVSEIYDLLIAQLHRVTRWVTHISIVIRAAARRSTHSK
jgi:hypothetical protein